MKKIVSLVLCFVMLLGTLSMVSFAADETLVQMGGEWDYIFYEDCTTPGPDGWTTGEDTAEWSKGDAPFAGAWYTNASAKTVAPWGTFAAYIRKTFTSKYC